MAGSDAGGGGDRPPVHRTGLAGPGHGERVQSDGQGEHGGGEGSPGETLADWSGGQSAGHSGGEQDGPRQN